MYPSERDWQAEEDCRTLQRAEEIRMDKKRMASAAKVANKQVAALKKVASRPSSRRK